MWTHPKRLFLSKLVASPSCPALSPRGSSPVPTLPAPPFKQPNPTPPPTAAPPWPDPSSGTSLLGLGVVVGSAGLLQLCADVVLIQFPRVTDHELLGKVLHREKRRSEKIREDQRRPALPERIYMRTLKANRTLLEHTLWPHVYFSPLSPAVNPRQLSLKSSKNMKLRLWNSGTTLMEMSKIILAIAHIIHMTCWQ